MAIHDRVIGMDLAVAIADGRDVLVPRQGPFH
jgi:hypothetical protein